MKESTKIILGMSLSFFTTIFCFIFAGAALALHYLGVFYVSAIYGVVCLGLGYFVSWTASRVKKEEDYNEKIFDNGGQGNI